MKMTKESSVPAGEPILGLDGFMRILEDMDEKGEVERRIWGEVSGPFSSRAVYSCTVKIGLLHHP